MCYHWTLTLPHALQTTLFRDSFGFCVSPKLYVSRSIGLDIFWNMILINSITLSCRWKCVLMVIFFVHFVAFQYMHLVFYLFRHKPFLQTVGTKKLLKNTSQCPRNFLNTPNWMINSTLYFSTKIKFLWSAPLKPPLSDRC